MTDSGRIFRLRGPAGFAARTIPVGLTFATLGVFGQSVVVVADAWRGDAATSPPPSIAVVFAVFWAMLAVIWKIHVGFVREVRQRPDRELEVTTVFGRKTTLGQGDVTDLRKQLFAPQPGSTRARTRDGKTFYFSTFEDKYDLVDALRDLQR
jgi:hypothetical protein